MIDNSIKRRRAAAPSSARRPRTYAPWRTATLVIVYLLFVLHFVHWKLAGRTLAPLELNEVMYTLELGIVTAGFLFMVVAMVATVVFGRFFCSWGCHILALEDLSAWLLHELRIHPKPIRSRVLRWVPLGAMLYMFAWPQVARLIAGQPMPALHLRTDAEGWASFLTSNFWRNLPGPGVTAITFFICGFVMVYMLGTRGFCTYACPYGALFRVADRFAPGRIVARGDCSQCGKCTAVCQSHVLVHRELAAYGRVIDSSCLKDLDCVAACPEGRVRYGLGSPAILTIGTTDRVARPQYSVTWGEDLLMASVFLAALFIYRGLYQLVPFLLALAIGGILAYSLVLLVRLMRRHDVHLNNVRLKAANHVTRSGWCFAGVSVALVALTGHSAVIRYHEFRGLRLAAQSAHRESIGNTENRASPLQAGIHDLEFCETWGLLHSPEHQETLSALHADWAAMLADQGSLAAAAVHLGRASALRPNHAPTHYNYGVILAACGKKADAIREYRRSISLDPSDAEVHNNLGLTLADTGDISAAIAHLTNAIRLNPQYAAPQFNLGRVYLQMGRRGEAYRLLENTRRLDSSYGPYVNELLGVELDPQSPSNRSVPKRTSP
ncbi:MAG: tetratricopeptide repeat protein [Planctomycetes bacterium]|nr:tetratricopeptide repeat protein [Planctomycetota bacterium]